MTELPENVAAVLRVAANTYGEISKNRFIENMESEALDNVKSPIEAIFYFALNLLCFAEGISTTPDPWYDQHGVIRAGHGISIDAQCKIDKYTVDFSITKVAGQLQGEPFESVIIELDGHDFHDKNKEQRAYEKARDRFFVKRGDKVLHYTGSEVVKDPYRIAHEVLTILHLGEGLEYDPKDPLGVGARGYW